MTNLTMRWDTPAGSGNPDQLFNQAVQAYMSGQNAQAEMLCQQVLSIHKDYVDAVNLLGALAYDKRDYTSAQKHFSDAHRLDSRNPSYPFNLAMIAKDQGQPDITARWLDAVLQLDPMHPIAMKERVELALEQKDYRAAEKALLPIIQHIPDDPSILGILAHVYEVEDGQKLCNRSAELASIYEKILRKQPNQNEVFYGNYLSALNRTHQLAKAVEFGENEVIARGHISSNILFNVARAYDLMGNNAKAVHYLGLLKQRDPNHHEAGILSTYVTLKKTNLATERSLYRNRFTLGKTARRFYPFNEWAGQPLEGKSILLWAEQGVGDIIMFCGFLPYIAQTARAVTVAIEAKILPLVQRSFPSITFVPLDDATDEMLLTQLFDYHAPMGEMLVSLLDIYQPRARSPYLIPDTVRVAEKRAEYAKHLPGFRVGIAWFTANDLTSHIRNISLAQWRPLLETPDCSFVSLQYGDFSEEISAFTRDTGIPLYQDTSFNQLLDTDGFATQIAALDAVISIQNTTVHMGGALGKDTTILLSKSSDFRWGLGREDNPWYPTVRILRQTTFGDWDSVIAQAKTELVAKCARANATKAGG